MLSLLNHMEIILKNAPDVSDSIPSSFLTPLDLISLCETCSNNMQLLQFFPDLSLDHFTTTTLPLFRQRIRDSTLIAGRNREIVLDNRLKEINAISTINLSLI